MAKKEIDENYMTTLAGLLETVMPKNYGFTLLVFETNTECAKVNYISSAEREDMLGTMKTFIDKWERPDFFTNPNQN